MARAAVMAKRWSVLMYIVSPEDFKSPEFQNTSGITDIHTGKFT